jgi:hypothetical protein
MPLSHACDCDLNPTTGYGLCDACQAADRPGTDDNPVGLVADPTSGDGRLTVCETCNRP